LAASSSTGTEGGPDSSRGTSLSNGTPSLSVARRHRFSMTSGKPDAVTETRQVLRDTQARQTPRTCVAAEQRHADGFEASTGGVLVVRGLIGQFTQLSEHDG